MTGLIRLEIPRLAGCVQEDSWRNPDARPAASLTLRSRERSAPASARPTARCQQIPEEPLDEDAHTGPNSFLQSRRPVEDDGDWSGRLVRHPQEETAVLRDIVGPAVRSAGGGGYGRLQQKYRSPD